jgi:CRP-like cAMP-binding protein
VDGGASLDRTATNGFAKFDLAQSFFSPITAKSQPMLSSQSMNLATYPVEDLSAGTFLLKRAQSSKTVIFVESGRVALGVAAIPGAAEAADASRAMVLEHQLGVVQGPAWLEATAAVLKLPSAVDAVAQTPVLVRKVPLADFHAVLSAGAPQVKSLLLEVAQAHRQQTELAVSRLAKDAEARCAEWLLRQAKTTGNEVCSVQLQQRKRMIAAQLGIAPETLSRVLRHLRERSLISGSGRVVNLDDMMGLRSLAGI